MREYINSQRPRSILAVIHHSIIASKIYFQGGKKPSKGKEVDESKGKGTKVPNASKTQDIKPKEKGYKGRSKLSPEEMKQYQKEGKFFKCSEHKHMSCTCPTKGTRK